MKVPPLIPASELNNALAQLEDWSVVSQDTAITKTFLFPDFAAAFAWMTRCATVAENMDHHPEWRNVYNRVEVVLTTHSAKGLTEFDLKLAVAMDRFQAEENTNV